MDNLKLLERMRDYVTRNRCDGDTDFAQGAAAANRNMLQFIDHLMKECSPLHTFLNAAASEGLVLDGIDAADLYIATFPQQYAAAVAAGSRT